MSKVQKVYRELRRYLSREDARYGAIKLVAMHRAGKLFS